MTQAVDFGGEGGIRTHDAGDRHTGFRGRWRVPGEGALRGREAAHGPRRVPVLRRFGQILPHIALCLALTACGGGDEDDDHKPPPDLPDCTVRPDVCK